MYRASTAWQVVAVLGTRALVTHTLWSRSLWECGPPVQIALLYWEWSHTGPFRGCELVMMEGVVAADMVHAMARNCSAHEVACFVALKQALFALLCESQGFVWQQLFTPKNNQPPKNHMFLLFTVMERFNEQQSSSQVGLQHSRHFHWRPS